MLRESPGARFVPPSPAFLAPTALRSHACAAAAGTSSAAAATNNTAPHRIPITGADDPPSPCACQPGTRSAPPRPHDRHLLAAADVAETCLRLHDTRPVEVGRGRPEGQAEVAVRVGRIGAERAVTRAPRGAALQLHLLTGLAAVLVRECLQRTAAGHPLAAPHALAVCSKLERSPGQRQRGPDLAGQALLALGTLRSLRPGGRRVV